MAVPNPALDAALAGLGRLHPKSIDLSLGRIEARLAALGNPEQRLPPIFHVAGTNGKGSTIAFLRAFLEAAGYRCHVYTSPHLVRFNERIRLAGRLIDDDTLMDLIREVEAAGMVDGVEQPITNFEITTAIAFLAFARVPADACLIEVGLGGRYDATNLFPRPQATAVTRISRDHRQFFGDVLTDIAGEKAGIFKRGVPAIVAGQPDDGVRERLSPNKLPVARWVEVIEACHAEGIRSTVTVMFGHIEEPWELAEHMRVVRELQERTAGFTEFVPLSFIPFHTLLGRTHGVEEISSEDNLKHTAAFRLALGRTVRNLQASWVKMGLDAATESLRWGVNDLGGTLMEESISRLAGSYHGVKLDPEDLVAAAHRAGRPAAERTTLYEIRRRYELPAHV